MQTIYMLWCRCINLIEYGNSYMETSGCFWQYYIHDPSDILTNSEIFKFKMKIAGKTPATGNTKDVKILK